MRNGEIVKIIAAATIVATLSLSAAEEEEDRDESGRWYAGASASLVMPQGGHPMRRAGGAALRVGCYLADTLSVEADATWLEDCAGLGVQGLWHAYGYERFDPFLTFGARGWIDGDVGPCAGIGTFYHLTDSWSLRADAQVTLGLDGECDMVYSLGVGVQYSF